MIRKFVLATAAVVALATVSLSPASAKGFHHHHGHGFGLGFGGLIVSSGYDSCLRNRWVVNRFGNLVLRTVNVCY